MQMYASQAGKSGGEYYTPQEVSELLARITVVGKTSVNKVYDPACGSGSLLLKFAKVLGKDNVRQGFYGQEINLTTYNLARINMFLHDVNYEKFNLAHGDTLIDPAHWDDEPFEAIVSNPPYSIKWDGDANPLLINDPRYAPAGVLAPKSKADLAFTMHMLSWLAVNGTAAIVEFPGVLYRGGAEQKIRQYLIDNNYVDAVIQLPPDLFFGTTIATCIIVLKKSKADNAVLFIDASAQFVRVGNKNKLTDDHQRRDPRRVHRPDRRRPLRQARPERRHRRQQLQHRGLLLRRAGGHPRGRRHHRAQRRDRPHRRPAARAARSDRRHRRRPGGDTVMTGMPTWEEFMIPTLRVLSDGHVQNRRHLCALVASRGGTHRGADPGRDRVRSAAVREPHRVGTVVPHQRRSPHPAIARQLRHHRSRTPVFSRGSPMEHGRTTSTSSARTRRHRSGRTSPPRCRTRRRRSLQCRSRTSRRPPNRSRAESPASTRKWRASCSPGSRARSPPSSKRRSWDFSWQWATAARPAAGRSPN